MAFQLERCLKKIGKAYDRREACQSGAWLHTWHMDPKYLERVVRTKFPTEAAAKKAFRAWLTARQAEGYTSRPKNTTGWTINPRGLRGYSHAGKTWGWPQKWGPGISVKVEKASS